jgi:hypothetical protein
MNSALDHHIARSKAAGLAERTALLVVAALAVWVGLIAFFTAWRAQGFSPASESAQGTVLTLAAGWGLIAVGAEPNALYIEVQSGETGT